MRGSVRAMLLVGVTLAMVPCGAASSASAMPDSSAALLDQNRTIVPERFGAAGDGVSDDSQALQAALDSLRPGDALRLPAGKVYRHTGLLTVNTAEVKIIGRGTLLATSTRASAVFINADDVEVADITVRFSADTPRLTGPEHHGLVVNRRQRTVIRKVTIDGSAAVGIFLRGASGYLIEDVVVKNTRADGIHTTEKSFDGRIVRPILRNTGDDGVAVVSYLRDGGVCHDITVESPRLVGQTHGRGFTVVGGERITYTDISSTGSSGAGVLIASEHATFKTYGSKQVTVRGGTVDRANQSSTTDHGAVLVSVQGPGQANEDITIEDLTITGTRQSASRQVGVISSPGSNSNQRVQFRNFTISGGPDRVFSSARTASNQYNRIGFTHNGAALPDHIGFSMTRS